MSYALRFWDDQCRQGVPDYLIWYDLDHAINCRHNPGGHYMRLETWGLEHMSRLYHQGLITQDDYELMKKYFSIYGNPNKTPQENPGDRD